jgi:hypothetical protein
MNDTLMKRLNEIVPKLLSSELLQGSGPGNEIGFYIFDYPPEFELEIREHIEFVKKELVKKKPDMKVEHVDLFRFILEYFKDLFEDDNVLDLAIEIQRNKGNTEVLEYLKGALEESKVAKAFANKVLASPPNLVIVSGVGAAYPLIRSHSLLNNLHHLLEHIPLVLFYPGVYDGQGLKLLDSLPVQNYYRAFRLVP